MDRLGKRFDTVLLAQSLVMIVAQLLLLELTVRLRPRTTQSSSSSSSLKRNLNPWLALQNERARSELLRSRTTDFWQWADVHVYVLALGGMCAVMSVGQLLFGGLSMWVEMVGAVALMLEAGLGVPQAWRNYERRSVRGLRWAASKWHAACCAG